MLGIRLDERTEAGLARMAKLTGRTRSDLAREAIVDYLRVAEGDDALDRELEAIAAATSEADLATLDAVNDDLIACIEQEERSATQSHSA